VKRSWIKQGRPPRLTATAILALVWLGAVLAVLQGFASSGPPSRVDASLVAHVTGMAAGYGAAAMLILMSRSPWLERDIGADRLTRWHAWGGPVVILLTVLHALAAVAAWAETRSIDLMAATKDLLEISLG
jgi:predicted ferric reductase